MQATNSILKGIAYQESGNGQPILFIHGLGCSGAVWQRLIPLLSQRYRCISVDIPGHGQSPPLSGTFTLSSVARQLLDFTNTLGLRALTIAGHSMGGQIAMLMALFAREYVQNLVLLAPAGLETFSPSERMMAMGALQYSSQIFWDEDAYIRSGSQNFYNHRSEYLAWQIALRGIIRQVGAERYGTMIHQGAQAMLQEPVFPFLKNLSMPTVIVFGEEDGFIPNRLIHNSSTRDMAKSAKKQFPNAALYLLRQCGHLLQWEKPDTAAKIINDFLKRS